MARIKLTASNKARAGPRVPAPKKAPRKGKHESEDPVLEAEEAESEIELLDISDDDGKGSDKAFKPPKGFDNNASSSESDSKGRDSDDDESVVKKKITRQSNGKQTRGRKRAASETDDESVEMRKSRRTPKPVTPFQIQEKLKSKSPAVDDSDDDVTGDDKSTSGKSEKEENGKKGKGRQPSTGKNLTSIAKGRALPRYKAIFEDGESPDNDDDTVVLPKRKPGPKSKTAEVESESESNAKKTAERKSQPQVEIKARTDAKPPLKKVAVDCGVRVEINATNNSTSKATASARQEPVPVAPAIKTSTNKAAATARQESVPVIPATKTSTNKVTASASQEPLPVVSNSSYAIRSNRPAAVKLDEDPEYIDLQKQLFSKQIELVEHEIYCRKLEILKQEKNLNLGTSVFTKELVEKKRPVNK